MFLLTFSYLLLCEFKYYEYVETNKQNNNDTINNTEIIINDINITENQANVSWIEYFLIFWIVSFLFRLLFEVNFLKNIYKFWNELVRVAHRKMT